jgi:acyl-CoA synthetase (AMP-forming)/AMP-acid ligase II
MSGGTIGDLLRRQAVQHADRPLLIDAADGSERTYAAVLETARRWCRYFADAGLAGGGRAAVVLANSPEYAEMYLGAALAGVTLCPYNPAWTDAEVVAATERYGASRLLAAPSRAAGLAASLTIPVVGVGPTGTLPAGLPGPADDRLEVRPDDVMVLVMTSGTSGGSKACRLSHANLCWTSARTVEAFALSAASRYLTPLPLFHVNAQVIGLLAAIQAGGAVIIGNRLPAAKLWESARRCRATGMSAVPAIVRDLLACHGDPPETLEFVVCSSAPLPAAVQAGFAERFGLPLLLCYGLSEAGCFVSYGPRRGSAPAKAVGRPLGCEVRVVDGEICVRGPGVFGGYDGDAAATASALPDGWLHTGDRGHLDEAGWLVIDGRLKEMINRGGEKIAPDAIEAVIGTCPGVQEVAVFAVPDERLGEEVAAAVVLSAGTVLSDDDLWDFCQDRLAEFEMPKTWQRLSGLPRGGTGKVLRRVLQEGWSHA